jgi:hypothetical protein
MKTKLVRVTRRMVERGALAIYRNAGWDRPWKEIAPSARSRFRKAAVEAIIAAIPTAIRVAK